MARGPGGSGHFFHTGQDLSSCSTNKAHIEGVGKAMYRVPIKNNCLSKILLKKSPKMIPQLSDFIIIQMFLCNLTSFPESDNEKNVFRSGPSPRFMACPVNERLDGYFFPDIQGSHALWRVAFV